jgi:hypothetical protein
MFERTRPAMTDLEAALKVVSAGSAVSSGLSSWSHSQCPLRYVEIRAQQVIGGFMSGSTGDQVARYILGLPTG